MTKHICLSITDELYTALLNRQKNHGYFTVQELINDLVRRGLFGSPRMVDNKGGRPKKFEFEDYFAGPPGSAIKNGSIWMKRK